MADDERSGCKALHVMTLGDPDGLQVELSTYGARITGLSAPLAGDGRRQVVVSDPRGAAYPGGYVGATVGRFANRIRDARFMLDGVEHRVGVVDRGHALHGGPEGFDTRTWTLVDRGPCHAEMELVSPDGDQGYPGTVTVRARFEVTGPELRTTYTAVTDAPTVLNLSSHSYYALDGGSGDQRLTVHAQRVLPVDDRGIPTGELLPVVGTAYDVTAPVRAGDLDLDHCFVLDGHGMRTVAMLESDALRLELATDQPGLQVFTGGGTIPGVALEPQLYPDSPHHPEWPSPVLRPGETYRWRQLVRLLSL